MFNTNPVKNRITQTELYCAGFIEFCSATMPARSGTAMVHGPGILPAQTGKRSAGIHLAPS